MSEVFERELDEEEKGVYADIGSGRDDFGEEGDLEREKVGVILRAKVLSCCNEAVEEDAFAIPDETWSTGG